MHLVYVTGPAGSGKSQLVAALAEWYEEKGFTVARVNLDPGAIDLPYEPDVDCRELVNIYELMEEKSLGPNGALIMAVSLVAINLDKLQAMLDDINPDLALVDTPGQLELFVFRESGPYITQRLRHIGVLNLFLFDATVAKEAANFVSLAFLAASTQLRLNLPQVGVLTKVDLAKEEVQRILRWISDSAALEAALMQSTASEYRRLLSRSVWKSIIKLGFSSALFPSSAVTLEGFLNLSAIITRILMQGEERGE
jgi:GTPase SAR1 family protein